MIDRREKMPNLPQLHGRSRHTEWLCGDVLQIRSKLFILMLFPMCDRQYRRIKTWLAGPQLAIATFLTAKSNRKLQNIRGTDIDSGSAGPDAGMLLLHDLNDSLDWPAPATLGIIATWG